jgi:hypothetical protein
VKLIVAIVLAATAFSATAACSKPSAKARPIYISIQRNGAITFGDHAPSDPESANKVNP